jgi:protein-histidine pros-kinase
MRLFMSIKVKINLLFLVLGILSATLISGFNYYEARQRIFDDALEKAGLISAYAMAAREYTVQTMRPLAREVAGPQSFHPEIMGGFFVARAISEKFAHDKPGYRFKQAAANPVNAINQADSDEMAIIARFAADPRLSLQKGVIEKDGENYFYIARPVRAQKGCLTCHSSKANAPRGRQEMYPGDGGYGYTENSVVASFVNYVPIQKALLDLKTTALKTMSIGIGSVLVILVAVWVFINRAIARPVMDLTALANDMSRGKKLDQDIKIKSKDEIGALYESFNRMRVSVVKLARLLKQKK